MKSIDSTSSSACTGKRDSAEFDNRYGHFAKDGAEYHISDFRTPRPWSNIIANPRIGLAVSQTGSGFTWIDNSQLAVITRWDQDFAKDSSGKFLYVRDADSGDLWSLSPAPTFPEYNHYTCRHGIGFTTFETEIHGIRAEWTLLVHPEDTVELWKVVLKNETDRIRRLDLCAFLEWCCGTAPSPRREFHKLFIETAWDADRKAIFAWNHMWDVPNEEYGHWNTDFPYVTAFGSTLPVMAAQGDKSAFFGQYGDAKCPAALEADVWTPQFGRHEDAIGAMQSSVLLKPGESTEFGYALAMGQSRDAAAELLSRSASVDYIQEALEEAKASWQVRLSDHRVQTPDTSINYLANDWVRYQAIAGRIWGRAGYYQQSGAYGYRDQLQDSQVWLTIDPDKTRKQINLHANHQFIDGSVYHWWHPLSEMGNITRMTDDLLWLSFVTANYLKETGNYDILKDEQPYLDSEKSESILEHVRRAFSRLFERTSPRGIPYIGEGDWNDGLSAAGKKEKGESVWLGHFLAGLLADWAGICEHVGECELAKEYKDRHEKLVAALNEHGWDGKWYMRGTLDDGSKLGSHECKAGRIFLNAQTWAILNDIADEDRQKQCWESVCEYLVSEVGALLLYPAFDTPDPRVGYITRYAPGLRENGGVYTHAATWAIAAAAKMRDQKRVGELLDAMNPTKKDPDRYWAEPYVLPGNVDGPLSPHFGRGGWTWYTGSAAWLHRIINEWVIGVRPEWDGLRIDPCMPDGWDKVDVVRPWRGHQYNIHLEKDASLQAGSIEITLDGKKVSGTHLPAPDGDSGKHDVVVRFA